MNAQQFFEQTMNAKDGGDLMWRCALAASNLAVTVFFPAALERLGEHQVAARARGLGPIKPSKFNISAQARANDINAMWGELARRGAKAAAAVAKTAKIVATDDEPVGLTIKLALAAGLDDETANAQILEVFRKEVDASKCEGRKVEGEAK